MKKIYIYLLVAIQCFYQYGCKDFLEIDEPKGQLPSQLVFNSEQTAEAALVSIYSDLRTRSSVSGNMTGNSLVYGLYTDELDYYGQPSSPTQNFYSHQVLPSNAAVKEIWSQGYKNIYNCNAIIEGVTNSVSISNAKKHVLIGEALFLRSMILFNLHQSFGEIPLTLTTNYIYNSSIGKSDHFTILEQIIEDLEKSKNLIGDENLTKKTRVNQFVISAFLARIYLYNERWLDAIRESSGLINSNQFHLEENLNTEFLVGSRSVIFHLSPRSSNENTAEGSNLLFEVGPPNNVALSTTFVDSFKPLDKRRLDWVKQVENDEQVWYMPYKYKERFATSESKEYSVIFRIAEQYLILSEASWKMNDYEQAVINLNIVRNRAGLESVEWQNSSQFLDLLIEERQHEFFVEQGLRWFDLKRWNLAGDYLADKKIGWAEKSYLFPIPESELIINSNLLPQNLGY